MSYQNSPSSSKVRPSLSRSAGVTLAHSEDLLLQLENFSY